MAIKFKEFRQYIGQRKTLCKEEISGSRLVRKNTVDKGILVTFKYGLRKNISHKNNKEEPIQPVQMNMFQSNVYKTDLEFTHFDPKQSV